MDYGRLSEDKQDDSLQYQGESVTKDCRICLDQISEQDDYLSPCLCKGSMKYVHRTCLNQWRATNQNPRAFTNCTECRFEYQLKRVIKQGPSSKCTFRYLIVRDSFGVFCVVQLIIILLGFIVGSIDKNQAFVRLLWGEDKQTLDRTGILSDILHHHKTTYYLAGILVALFFLGLGYSIYYCCAKAGSSSNRDPHYHHHHRYLFNDPWLGCYCYDCPRCNSGNGNCSGDGNEACAIIAIIIVVIFIIVGIFVGLFLTTVLIHRIVQRHYHILHREVLAEEYVVLDINDIVVESDLKSNYVKIAIKPHEEDAQEDSHIVHKQLDEDLKSLNFF